MVLSVDSRASQWESHSRLAHVTAAQAIPSLNARAYNRCKPHVPISICGSCIHIDLLDLDSGGYSNISLRLARLWKQFTVLVVIRYFEFRKAATISFEIVPDYAFDPSTDMIDRW